MSLIFVGKHLPGKNLQELEQVSMNQMAMLVNIDRCIDCHGCEVGCFLVEEHSDCPRLSPVIQIEHDGEGAFNLLNFSMRCAHCDNPQCLLVCPVNAYRKDRNGFVIHDSERCIGCELCRLVCPYGAPKYDKVRKQTVKCDFCIDRVKGGQQPECVVNCIASAITFGKVGNILETISGRISKGDGCVVMG